MQVYRFENAKGYGPWSGGGWLQYDENQRIDENHSCESMPTPSQEFGTELKDHHQTKGLCGYYFGFRTKTQLKGAFPSMAGRRAMSVVGQTLKVYEIDDEHVLQGNAQVAFKKDKARLVGELDLATLQPMGDA